MCSFFNRKDFTEEKKNLSKLEHRLRNDSKIRQSKISFLKWKLCHPCEFSLFSFFWTTFEHHRISLIRVLALSDYFMIVIFHHISSKYKFTVAVYYGFLVLIAEICQKVQHVVSVRASKWLSPTTKFWFLMGKFPKTHGNTILILIYFS